MANIQAYARWLRATRGEVSPRLAQSELAKMAGVSHSYINRLENADKPDFDNPINNPGVELIDKISRALERYIDRPLVNEARRAIGWETLPEEPAGEANYYASPATAEEAMAILTQLLEPQNVDVFNTTREMLRMSPQQRQPIKQMTDLAKQLTRP